ncbi:transcriptional regulator MelR [Thaumasiovibrio sp. DFM-14]|uniref:transcriptional regulator MelR n=1 Tax=Thaumasiovibrio sp. DFM-14 TaxID=3384792 RepID=UPI0039A2900E
MATESCKREDAYISPLGLYSSYEQIFVEMRLPQKMDAYHWHSQVEINIPYEGDVDYLINGKRFTVKQGHIGVFWGTIPHKLIDAKRTQKMAIINLPIHMLFSLPLDTSLVQQITHGVVVQSLKPCLIQQQQIASWVDAGKSTDITMGQLMVDEIALMLKRMSLTGWDTLTNETEKVATINHASKQSQYYVRQILEYIYTNHQKPISTKSIAEHVGLHANYVMNFFHSVMNMTIKEYITAMRINHARALLTDTNKTIMDVALSVGFNSSSRFYDNFSKYLNMTPTQFRRVSRLHTG